MSTPFSISELSPFPFVELTQVHRPANGLLLQTPSCCTNWTKHAESCRGFYEAVRADDTARDTFRQCPRGFACYSFVLNGRAVAFTCLVPWPRLGGLAEKKRADECRLCRVEQHRVMAAALALVRAERQRLDLLTYEIKHYSSALHEIRKFNRTIKQEAERLAPKLANLPTAISEPLTRIQKSAELMSTQFGIMELIANEEIAKLERKTRSEVFRIVDKCVHIYEVEATKRNLTLSISGDSPHAIVCDKTFPIIPTVLIDNAIRYSLPGSNISVRVENAPPRHCLITVVNTAQHIESLPDIFQKGVRGNDDGTGHGLGLHLARLVATQHGATLNYERTRVAHDRDQYTFTLRMETSELDGSQGQGGVRGGP